MLKEDKYTFIGMSGVGKSTFARRLSNKHGYKYIDIDTVIEKHEGKKLPAIIKKIGRQAFLELEEKIITELELPEKCILAPGGSVIYLKKAMNFFKKHSTIVYLNDSIDRIKSRTDYKNRGIVSPNYTKYDDIFNERVPLYKKYAHITVNYPDDEFRLYKIQDLIESKLS